MKSVILSEGDAVYLIKVDEGSSYGDVYVRGWAKNAKGERLVDEDGSPTLTDGLNAFVGNYNPDLYAWIFKFIYLQGLCTQLPDRPPAGWRSDLRNTGADRC